MVKLREEITLEGPKTLESIYYSDTEPISRATEPTKPSCGIWRSRAIVHVKSSREHTWGAETETAGACPCWAETHGPAFVRGLVQRLKPDPTLRLLCPNPHKNPNLMCHHCWWHDLLCFRWRSRGVLLLRFRRFAFFDAAIPTSMLTSTLPPK